MNGAPPRAAATAEGISAAVPSDGTPRGITTSRPAERRPGPKISSISSATNSDPVNGRTARDRPPDRGFERAYLRSAELRIANERAVVDAHDGREPAGGREVVRRVNHVRRT